MRTRPLLTLAVVLLVALVAGCGSSSHQIDRKAWAHDLAGLGKTVSDWPQYEAAVKSMCNDDDLATQVAVNLDGGEDLDQMRVDFQNACPDKVDDLEHAITDERNAVGNVQEACDTPPGQRTQEQNDLAEAMGC